MEGIGEKKTMFYDTQIPLHHGQREGVVSRLCITKNERQKPLCVEMGACHSVWKGDKFMLASETAGGVCVWDTDVRSDECELVASRAPLTLPRDCSSSIYARRESGTMVRNESIGCDVS